MFRIHDIVVWIRIRIRGSMPLTNGSGSWIRILLFSSLTFKNHQKTNFFFLLLFEGTFTSFFKDKKSNSHNSRNQGFSYYFCLLIEGSGSGSIPLTNGSGSGSGRPKNMWLRWIWIGSGTLWESHSKFLITFDLLKKTLTTFSLLFAGSAGTLGSRHTPDLQIRTVIA